MYGSQASPKDLNLTFPINIKPGKEVQQRNREAMDSDHHHHPHQQQQQINSNLMRFRSAPSSLFANFMPTSETNETILPPRSSSPETESMLTRFMSCGNENISDIREIQEKSLTETTSNHSNFSSSSQMVYHLQSQANHSSATVSSVPAERPYRDVNSMAMNFPHLKSASSNGPNLIRHRSSPAGLFANLNVENGYAAMRGMTNFRGANGEHTGSRLKGQINFSSRPESVGLMSQLTDKLTESIGGSSPDDANANNRCYIPGYPISSWDDSPLVSENFSSLKRTKDLNGKILSDSQNVELGSHTPILTHQFSLPKTSSEMAAIEKFMQFQDSVPCKIRAKRGCATHPRSIAERVRRTKISERMRRLQELVPNMDKQTNTADMLDLAVDYIKDLQKQVQILTDNRANCSCSNTQKQYQNPTS